MRHVLVDRDGVLNVDRPDSVLTPDQLVLEPSAAAGLALLAAHGWSALVVTNQSCVGRGLLSIDGLEAIHQRMRDLLGAAAVAIGGFYICPHRADEGCPCRKPRPGLLVQACAEHRLVPTATWMVGDDVRDAESAINGGCRPALVKTGKGQAAARARPDLPAFADFAAFAAMLVATEGADVRQP
jgi:D-glycero-D-manno-heptose 1,7-bisphosphate phosphatase